MKKVSYFFSGSKYLFSLFSLSLFFSLSQCQIVSNKKKAILREWGEAIKAIKNKLSTKILKIQDHLKLLFPRFQV
jgi:chromosome condensin MukBEF complex kleisin-like MukF subunit